MDIKLKAFVRFLREMHNVVEINLKTGVVVTDGYEYAIEKGAVDIVQFTGLKDKNGVEIYCGDIVKHHFNGDEKYSIGKVVYGRSHDEGGELQESVGFFRVGVASSFYKFKGQDIKIYDCGTSMTYGLRELEVIGNIYQNPELLA